MKFRIVFWDVLPCKIIVDRRFRGTCCLYHQGWVCLLYNRDPFALGSLIPDDGCSTYFWNVGRQLFYTAVHPTRQFWTLYFMVYKRIRTYQNLLRENLCIPRNIRIDGNSVNNVRFQVIRDDYKMIDLWDRALCSTVEVGRHFRGADGGRKHLWNAGLLQRDYTALYPRRLSSLKITMLRRNLWTVS
jgi:hypothetical protein